ISLGYAPNPGLARRITKSEILNKLALAGKPSDDLLLPDSILVHRQTAGLNRDQVTRAILGAFISRFPGANIEIINVDIPTIQVGTGAIEINASLPTRFDPGAPVFVRMDVKGTSFAKTVFARTVVRVEAEQPVLKNKIEAHSEIKPED